VPSDSAGNAVGYDVDAVGGKAFADEGILHEMRRADDGVSLLVLGRAPRHFARRKAGEGKAEPAVLLVHDPLLHEDVAVHRLNDADGPGTAQPPQRAQSRAAIEKKEIRFARRTQRTAVEPELAYVSQFLAGPCRGADA